MKWWKSLDLSVKKEEEKEKSSQRQASLTNDVGADDTADNRLTSMIVSHFATPIQILVWLSFVESVDDLSIERKKALRETRLETVFTLEELSVFDFIANLFRLKEETQNEMFCEIVFNGVWSLLWYPRFYAAFRDMYKQDRWPLSQSHFFLERWVFCMVRFQSVCLPPT
jgi:hypothetical protein